MYAYRAYNLALCSEFELPQLLTNGDHSAADVFIRCGTPDEFPPEAQAVVGLSVFSPRLMSRHWPDVGTFLIRGGSEIVVLPATGVSDSALSNAVVTTAMNILLYQRGHFVVHASVVAVDDQAVAFCGVSGSGKSTLAAALQQRGHPLMADDILAVDLSSARCPLALPAFPQIKLWPSTLDTLGIPAEQLPRLHPIHDKRFQRFTPASDLRPLPLARLYMLERGDTTALTMLQAQAALGLLFAHSLVGNIAHTDHLNLPAITGSQRTYLGQCAQLIDHVPVRRFTRRWTLDALSESLDCVEQDLGRM